jgi:hypothetical protein
MPGSDSFASEGNGSSVRDQVRGIKDRAIEQGRTSLRDARDRAASSLGESKNQVAEQIGAVAQAFRRAGDQLRTQGQGERIVGLTDAMAQQAEHAADYLRRADGEVLRQDVEGLTRRQPALVLGGAFVAGLIGARFLKSSERRQFEDRSGRASSAESGYGQTGYRERYEERGMAGDVNAAIGGPDAGS